jgi:hypothetical protein
VIPWRGDRRRNLRRCVETARFSFSFCTVAHGFHAQHIGMLPDAYLNSKTAFEIGWDASRIRKVLWPDTHPWINEGYQAGVAHFGVKRIRGEPTTFDLKRLQLRISAWKRGIEFDLNLTAANIQAAAAFRCPITRRVFTSAKKLPTDWSVDRLNNRIGYTRRNIAVISAEANEAKGSFSAVEIAQFLKAQTRLPNSSLDFDATMRLAVMTAISTTDAPLDTPCLFIPHPMSWMQNIAYYRRCVVLCTLSGATPPDLRRWASRIARAKPFLAVARDLQDAIFYGVERAKARDKLAPTQPCVAECFNRHLEDAACEPLVDRGISKLIALGINSLSNETLGITTHHGRSGVPMYSWGGRAAMTTGL